MIWLFSRFDSTHAVALSVEPLQMIMSNTPELVVKDGVPDTLAAIQRVAATVAQRGRE